MSTTSFPKSRILAHRGRWGEASRANSLGAMRLASSEGFGIEVDVRDSNGDVVVAHDPVSTRATSLETAIASLKSQKFDATLALDVKSDGLLDLMTPNLMAEFRKNCERYFFFDMAMPEHLRYAKAGLTVAKRVSEFESSSEIPSVFRNSKVNVFWLDCFSSDWWLSKDWNQLFPPTGRVWVVSPELHGRKPDAVWERVVELHRQQKWVGICTDYPVEFLEMSL